jgi:PTS system nitrogen regulatory IIA component
MDITPLIPLEHVAVGVHATDKRSVIQSVARLTAQVEESIDEQALVAALMQREALGTTGLGRGIAVPHATLPGLRKTVVTVTRLAEPVEYGSSDGEDVGVVFSLVSGKELQHDQLRALARIARLAMRHNLASELDGLTTPAEVRDRLQALEDGLNQQ